MNNNKIFIYNHILADWLIKNGAIVIGAGKNRITGETYIVFTRDSNILSLLKRWNPKNHNK